MKKNVLETMKNIKQVSIPKTRQLANLSLMRNKKIGGYARSFNTQNTIPKKTDLGILGDYMFNEHEVKTQETHPKKSVFFEVEKLSKIYEDEIIKFLGTDLAETQNSQTSKKPQIKPQVLKPNHKNSLALNKSWSQQLKKLEEKEKVIKKSLELLDIQKKKKIILNPTQKLPKLQNSGILTKKIRIISKSLLKK